MNYIFSIYLILANSLFCVEALQPVRIISEYYHNNDELGFPLAPTQCGIVFFKYVGPINNYSLYIIHTI